MEKYYNLTSVKDGNTLNVSIDEELGFFGTNSDDFKRLLNENKDSKVNVDINSGGGSLFQGIAIFNILGAHPQEVTTNVTGVAGSASSLIFMAGHKRTMALGSHLMIHKPQFSPFIPQDADDLRKVADNLDIFQESIVAIYASVVNSSHEEIKRMVNEETWINADDALRMGFSTGTTGDLAISNNYEIAQYVNNCHAKIPEGALKYFTKDKDIQQVLNELNELLNPDEVDMKPEDFKNELADMRSKLDEEFTNQIGELTKLVKGLTDTVLGKDKENKDLTTLVSNMSVELINMRKETASTSIGTFIDGLIAEGRIFPSHREREIQNISNRTGEDQTAYKTELSKGDVVIDIGSNWAREGYTPEINAGVEASIQTEILAMTTAKGVPKNKLSSEDMDLAAQLAWDKQQGVK